MKSAIGDSPARDQKTAAGEKCKKKLKYRLRYKNIDYICIVYDRIVTDVKISGTKYTKKNG